MFPSEMIILMAIAVNKDPGKNILNRPMDIIGEYIGYLYDSLVRRSYLKKNGSGGYQLTLKGRDALFELLFENKTKIKDTLKRLQQLGIEISQEQQQKIEKFGKEEVMVK